MNIIELLSETTKEWFKDKPARYSAALAFYSLLSMGPILLITISLAGLIFGPEAARGELFGQLRGLMGEDAAAFVQTVLASTASEKESIWASIIGAGILLFAAVGFFGQLQAALNMVWNVPPPTTRKLRKSALRYSMRFAMLLMIGFLLYLSVMVSALLTIFSAYLDQYVPATFIQLMHQGVTFGMSVLLFAAIYKLLPDARILWRQVWIGALITSVLFFIGRYAIGLYIEYSALSSAYGAAGTLIVILLWIYYSALIFMLGAEFTQVYSRKDEPK